MDPHKDFHQNMGQLVELLRRILANIPSQMQKETSSSPQNNKDANTNFNINFCFMNLFPISEEELEEMEEAYEQWTLQQDGKTVESKSDLTISDLEFLKKNGIRF